MNEHVDTTPSVAAPTKGVIGYLATARALADRIPDSALLLVLRVCIAIPFWRSGRAKADGFLGLQDLQVYLFADEYRPFGAIDLPFPGLMAHLALYMETLLPILLWIGLGTRFAALGLLAMTAVIITIYPGQWANEYIYWVPMLLVLLARGGGAWSVDHHLKPRLLGNH